MATANQERVVKLLSDLEKVVRHHEHALVKYLRTPNNTPASTEAWAKVQSAATQITDLREQIKDMVR